MRYQNWDILVFPDMCKIPLQEFKTSCQVVQDPETHSFQTNPHLLPTVTCFVPGLDVGTPFRVSIHCWQNPEVSRYLQSFRKPSDNIMFEARLFVDGRIIGSKWFQQAGPWPTVLDISIDLDKHGDFEKLKFPAFHKELLLQSYWNADDDLGRIKLVISEGFARGNLTYPYERIKNIASFSFQHAPLDVLEASSIAWPNASMWRQVSLVGPYMAQQQSPRTIGDGVEAHGHSPRRASTIARTLPVRGPGSMLPPSTIYPRQETFDPFTDQVHAAFTGWRQASATDISMPDYSSSSGRTRANSSRQVTDPMSISSIQDRRFEAMGMPDSQFDSLREAIIPSAPVNTPQNEENTPVTITATRKSSSKASKEQEFETIKQNIEEEESVPAVIQGAAIISNVKSRKENVQTSPLGARSCSASKEENIRKVSQTIVAASNSGNKRQRIITSAASKAIDDEDEPRSSPSTRKVSRASVKQDAPGQRRVLSSLTNIGRD